MVFTVDEPVIHHHMVEMMTQWHHYQMASYDIKKVGIAWMGYTVHTQAMHRPTLMLFILFVNKPLWKDQKPTINQSY